MMRLPHQTLERGLDRENYYMRFPFFIIAEYRVWKTVRVQRTLVTDSLPSAFGLMLDSKVLY